MHEARDCQEESVNGHGRDVHGEEHEILLISLSDAVVDPGAVMIHLSDAPLTN